MGLLRLLRRICCCGGGYKSFTSADEGWQVNLTAKGAEEQNVTDLLAKSQKAREEAWGKLGTLEPLIGQNLGTPAVTGPKWPASRQSFRMVKRSNGNVILASDGLSDPFDDVTLGEGNVNGFGLEFFIETTAEEMADLEENVKKSWPFLLLYTVSQLAASHGGIRAILDDMKLLSTEAEGVNEAVAEEFRTKLVNAAGRVGALLGLQSEGGEGGGSPMHKENGTANGGVHAGTASGVPERIPGMPLTEVKLVNIKLLTLDELKLITDKGAEGRRKLSELFAGPARLVSSITRPSVLD